jgi:hypothetical protein
LKDKNDTLQKTQLNKEFQTAVQQHFSGKARIIEIEQDK